VDPVDIGAIAGQLRTRGLAVVEKDSLPAALLVSLAESCHGHAGAQFAPAGIGRGEDRRRDTVVRGDAISWLDQGKDADREYLTLMEGLRVSLNEHLFLGLYEYECHYAVYDTGAHYQKHLDVLAGRKNRLLSTVVYLDSEWALADGGELVLYRGSDPVAIARILPQPGLMVMFLSEGFPHEVLAATRPRHSIAGWFRGRAPEV
jgi:SM-20-related protein